MAHQLMEPVLEPVPPLLPPINPPTAITVAGLLSLSAASNNNNNNTSYNDNIALNSNNNAPNNNNANNDNHYNTKRGDNYNYEKGSNNDHHQNNPNNNNQCQNTKSLRESFASNFSTSVSSNSTTKKGRSAQNKKADNWPQSIKELAGKKLVKDLSADGLTFICVPCLNAAKGKEVINCRHPYLLGRWIEHQRSVSHRRAMANIAGEEEQRKRRMKKTGVVEKRKLQVSIGGLLLQARGRRLQLTLVETMIMIIIMQP